MTQVRDWKSLQGFDFIDEGSSSRCMADMVRDGRVELASFPKQKIIFQPHGLIQGLSYFRFREYDDAVKLL